MVVAIRRMNPLAMKVKDMFGGFQRIEIEAVSTHPCCPTDFKVDLLSPSGWKTMSSDFRWSIGVFRSDVR
jgi:hypothetical protein